MDKRIKVFSNIAIGIMVIIITLVVFFVGFEKVEKSNLDHLALMFILLSEVALFTGLILLLISEAPMSSIIIRSGLMSLAAIISISLFIAASNVNASNTKIQSNRVLLQESENMVFNLKNKKAYALYKESLDRLYETIKYRDKVAYNSTLEERINEHIVNLSNNLKENYEDKEAISESIENIITLIKERNMEVHTAKRGGF